MGMEDDVIVGVFVVFSLSYGIGRVERAVRVAVADRMVFVDFRTHQMLSLLNTRLDAIRAALDGYGKHDNGYG
jgi:hypothetical protein